MDNETDQSAVAYENGPKEVNTNRRMPSTEKQIGKSKNLPKPNRSIKSKFYPANPTPGRNTEFR